MSSVLTLAAVTALATIVAVAVAIGRLRYRRRKASFRRIFNALALPNVTEDRCDIRQLILLPPPAGRYLRRALPADGWLARTVDLYLVGRIRPQPGAGWIGFEAHQRICPERGFICESRLQGLGPVTLEGAEYLFEQTAGSEFFLGHAVNLVRESGEALRRNAAGRLLIESIWLPGALIPEGGVRWQPGDHQSATAVVPATAGNVALNFVVADDGALIEVSMMRHGDAGLGHEQKVPFTFRVEDEASWDGYTVPSEVVGIWDHGTRAAFPFLQFRVENARYF